MKREISKDILKQIEVLSKQIIKGDYTESIPCAESGCMSCDKNTSLSNRLKDLKNRGDAFRNLCYVYAKINNVNNNLDELQIKHNILSIFDSLIHAGVDINDKYAIHVARSTISYPVIHSEQSKLMPKGSYIIEESTPLVHAIFLNQESLVNFFIARNANFQQLIPVKEMNAKFYNSSINYKTKKEHYLSIEELASFLHENKYVGGPISDNLLQAVQKFVDGKKMFLVTLNLYKPPKILNLFNSQVSIQKDLNRDWIMDFHVMGIVKSFVQP